MKVWVIYAKEFVLQPWRISSLGMTEDSLFRKQLAVVYRIY